MLLLVPDYLAYVRERTGKNFPDRPPLVSLSPASPPEPAPRRPPPDPASVLDSSETPVWERKP